MSINLIADHQTQEPGMSPLLTLPSLRRCGDCKGSFPLDQFSVRDPVRGTYRSKCKACVRAYSAKHYRADKPTYVAKAARHNKEYSQRNNAVRAAALKNQCCCGCSSKEHLTFYNGGFDKGQPVNMAVGQGLSEASVLDALGRSVIVCRHCLGAHFGKALAFWQQMSHPERLALQQSRAARGEGPVDRRAFRRYRPVQVVF